MADSQIKWMYEGMKSDINREDYLLGKKIDKNFELYSDVVRKENEGGIEAVSKVCQTRTAESSKSAVVSNLEVDIVRTEDPLVAIKVKEETLRQERLGNPLMALKMRKLLRKEMKRKERKQKKILKKLLKKMAKEDKKRQSSSHGRDESTLKPGKAEKESGFVGASTSRADSSEAKNLKTKERQIGPYIPEHLRQTYSGDFKDDARHSGSKETKNLESGNCSGDRKFGLVDKFKDRRRKSRSPCENPYKGLHSKWDSETYKKTEKKMAAQEMEARRKRMMENAQWREKVRDENIEKAARLEKEGGDSSGRFADVIKPTMTMEERLVSQRQRLQSTHRFTEGSFLKR